MGHISHHHASLEKTGLSIHLLDLIRTRSTNTCTGTLHIDSGNATRVHVGVLYKTRPFCVTHPLWSYWV